jgi:beta-aspartyl-peptidase (threonine type)
MTKIILTGSEGGAGMQAAADALRHGLPALDIVETAIRPVETDPTVRSVGLGGYPNLLGQIELDASIMDGWTMRSGAVGALQGYLHPISIARQVMERLPHVMLVGEGAARFAAEIGAEMGDNLTEEARQSWEKWLTEHASTADQAKWPNVPLAEYARLSADPETAGGTTVALVQDSASGMAAGVSTCGWAFKYPGRLGDSPIVGAGLYADDRWGAAACTGMGELTIRAGTARAVVLYIKMGMDVRHACREAIADLRTLQRQWQGGVTLHAIDHDGNPYVITIGREGPQPYWIWKEGMDAPERHMSEHVQW